MIVSEASAKAKQRVRVKLWLIYSIGMAHDDCHMSMFVVQAIVLCVVAVTLP